MALSGQESLNLRAKFLRRFVGDEAAAIVHDHGR